MSISAVVSYPGAKWKAWPQIKPLIPRDIDDWREPFFGGGSMSLLMAEDLEFNLKQMIVGDFAPEVWAFWTGCRDYGPDVVAKAKEIFTANCPTHAVLQTMSENEQNFETVCNKALEEGKTFFLNCKKTETAMSAKTDKDSIIERAARFILVNRISFSGMGYAGSMSNDQFRDFKFDKLNRIIDAQPLLQKMEIKNCSFEETMSNVDKDKTFIFLDPPYFQQGTTSPMYGMDGNTHRGFPHEHFAEFTKNTQCRWLITYDDSIKVRRMFKGCYIRPYTLTYTMAGKTSEDALAGEELFIANYDIREKTSEDLFNLL